MLLAEQEKLKIEVDTYLATRTTAMADAVYLNPVSEYTDIERLRREEQLLFRRLPLVLAHSSEIVAAGAYITRDVLSVPVLIVRQADDNVARGTPAPAGGTT